MAGFSEQFERINISIHALRKESDQNRLPSQLTAMQFQSTLSVRRATLASGPSIAAGWNFNPRSP